MFENKSNQDALICDFLKLKKIAVVGSFRNEMKVAYAIVRHLLAAQKYEIFPVNPNINEVEGLKVCAEIPDLPENIEIVNIVTPPEVSLQPAATRAASPGDGRAFHPAPCTARPPRTPLPTEPPLS